MWWLAAAAMVGVFYRPRCFSWCKKQESCCVRNSLFWGGRARFPKCDWLHYEQKHCFIVQLGKASKNQFKTNEMSTLASWHWLAANFRRRYLSDIFCTVYWLVDSICSWGSWIICNWRLYSRTVLVPSISKYSLIFNTASVEEYYEIRLVLSTEVEKRSMTMTILILKLYYTAINLWRSFFLMFCYQLF
jgi:hypothetical protein